MVDMELFEKLREPLGAWLAAATSLIGLLVIGSLLFPAQVFDGFIWRYFWGPVVADAHGVSTAGCAVREAGEVTIHAGANECATATGIVAHPGYTTISTVSYAIVLLFAIVGVVLWMHRLDIGNDRSLFYGLIPFVFLGGTLRVIEDANSLLFRETGDMLFALPWVGFIISPLIYFLVFFIAAIALLVCLWLEREEVVEEYSRLLAAIGAILLVGSLVIIGYFYTVTDVMDLTLSVAIISLGGATVITGVVWVLTERYWPEVNEGTAFMGPVIIWGHTVDGIANVLSLDWAQTIGLTRSYEPKHVINAGIRDVTSTIQPTWLSDSIGTVWPFLPVKVIVAVVVVWVFNDEVFEESPSFTMLMLLAILAVGLGPGTRDFLRATVGI